MKALVALTFVYTVTLSQYNNTWYILGTYASKGCESDEVSAITLHKPNACTRLGLNQKYNCTADNLHLGIYYDSSCAAN